MSVLPITLHLALSLPLFLALRQAGKRREAEGEGGLAIGRVPHSAELWSHFFLSAASTFNLPTSASKGAAHKNLESAHGQAKTASFLA